MIDKNSIPTHWKLENLGKICKTTSGGTPSRKVPSYYNGNIPWVKSGELDNGLILDTEEKITESAVTNSSAKILPKGTLLIALYGASIGKISFLGVDAATNQAVCGIFESPGINHKFLFHFLSFAKPILVQQSIGGAQPNISQGILKNLNVPLPPLTEQDEIVQKIEELFSELDAGRRQLETVKEQLKTYRQAVLKYAFEGRFTRKSVLEGEIPESWEWKELGSITDKITDGTHFTPKYVARGVPFISVKDIRGGEVHFDNCKYIKSTDHDLLKRRCYPEKGDILMTKSGSIGRLALVPDKEFSLFVSVALIKMKNRANEINSRWLIYFLEHHINNLDIKSKVKGGVIKNYHIEDLKQVRIPLCPFIEQNLMVQEIESRLPVCDKLEKTIESAINKTESLKQSILKQAFEGKLV